MFRLFCGVVIPVFLTLFSECLFFMQSCFCCFGKTLIPDFRNLHAVLVEISFSILVVLSRLSILFLVLPFPPACLRKHFLA